MFIIIKHLIVLFVFFFFKNNPFLYLFINLYLQDSLNKDWKVKSLCKYLVRKVKELNLSDKNYYDSPEVQILDIATWNPKSIANHPTKTCSKFYRLPLIEMFMNLGCLFKMIKYYIFQTKITVWKTNQTKQELKAIHILKKSMEVRKACLKRNLRFSNVKAHLETNLLSQIYWMFYSRYFFS